MVVCQYLRLLIIFLKIKSWKFLFMAVVAAALVSNLYLYRPMGDLMLRLGEKHLQVIGPKDFQEENYVVSEYEKNKVELDIMDASATRMSGINFGKETLQRCRDSVDCQQTFFKLLLGNAAGKMAHFVDFAPDGKLGKGKLQCQFSSGSELYCPYMAYLFGVAQDRQPNPPFELNTTHVFRLRSAMKPAVEVKGGNDSACRKDHNFLAVFPRTLMAQMIFVAITLVFYLLVSTVSCIHELKQTGFLQLMFRRQLSVTVYWMCIWTVTLIEMAIFAAILTLAYHLQCPGFFTTSQLINAFLGAFLQFCVVAATCLLCTVLTRSVGIMSILACLPHFLAIAFIVIIRAMISQQQKLAWARYIMLIVPFGHIAEQMHLSLLKGIIPDDKIVMLLMPICGGLVALLFLITLYLDFVIKAGNGLNFPNVFFFRPRFWSVKRAHRGALTDQEPSFMVESVPQRYKQTVKLSDVKKKYKFNLRNLALKAFSAAFHQDQITAVVGHNGSGKSTLLQILSGERHPTSGMATLNDFLLTDPLFRYHMAAEIGYCPQTDALVDRLTVMDTLKLTAVSSDLAWGDASEDVTAVLTALQIDDKIHHSIGSLSSSDKRKVCVAMALVGKPSVLLLDSPTRDMDYISKRRMWKLLHEYKKGRTVIFSTLFIDEADGIADRMIFLSGGKQICAGSSFFLKRVFDCRYIIQIASKTELHVPFIIRRITSKFQTVRVRSVANADVELEISILEDDILPAVAAEVESISELVDEFGIVQFSLDDVFSKLKGLAPVAVEGHIQSSTIGYVADDVDRMKKIKNRPLLKTQGNHRLDGDVESTKLRTVVAMFIASCQQIKRSPPRLIFRVVVPVVFLLLILAGSVLEGMMANTRRQVKFDLSNTKDLEKEGGRCMSFRSTTFHTDQVQDDECYFVLTGSNRSTLGIVIPATSIKTTPLDIPEFDMGNFVRTILSKKILTEIATGCKLAKRPCPLMITTSWCFDKLDLLKEFHVHVGTYVSGSYSPVDVATESIAIYKYLLMKTAKKLTESTVPGSYTRKDTLIPNFVTEGIEDIRNIFFPFYGLFIHMVFLAVIPAIFMDDVMKDKTGGVRGQLASMGMTQCHYWICTFVSHWIQLAIIYILCLIPLIAVASPAYSNAFFLAVVIPPTLIIGLINSLLCVYAVSSVVQSDCYMCIPVYACFSLIVALLVLIIQPYHLAGLIMIYVCPQYAIVGLTFYSARFTHYALSFYKAEGAESVPNLLQYFLSGIHPLHAVIAMAIHCVLLLLLFILLESRHRLPCCKKSAGPTALQNAYENSKEPALAQEVTNIQKNPRNEENSVEISQLSVKTGAKQSVKNLTFGVRHGEIFGLLGPCGSGKGSALRAIIGDRIQCAGRVEFFVNGNWLSSDDAVQKKFIGYCPKQDPLFQRLTVRENLHFYSRAIGVPLERVQVLVKHFRLEGDVNEVIFHATAGVKRRLSVAIAALMNPGFLVIDQASAGVDPEGRQILWQSVKSLACKQRSILVATQCMEEAEMLCGRVSIINGGLMATINTVDELIVRYRSMYFIEIQISDTDNETSEIQSVSDADDETSEIAYCTKEELVQLVQDKFFGSIVMEQLTLRVQFGIPIKSIGRLSNALNWLVNLKKKFNILYFTIHYATVDQTMKAIIVHHENQILQQEEEETSAA